MSGLFCGYAERVLDQVLGRLGDGNSRREFGAHPIVPGRELEKLIGEAKLSLEMFELAVLLGSELRNHAFEAGVLGADLLGNRAGAVLQVGENITHERFPLAMTLCGPGEGLTRELGGCTLNCGHTVELFGQFDSQK
jgi:hypothetical protein